MSKPLVPQSFIQVQDPEHNKQTNKQKNSQFLANVNSRSHSLYVIVRPTAVCRVSVTLMHPTQAMEIFHNVSSHLVSWPSADIQVKFYGDRPRGTPPSGEHKRVAEYSDFWPIERYITETVQDRS